jgi:CheY-like chemotaxis protein
VVTQTILTRYGYTVLLAEDGAEAVEVFRGAGGTIDLVLLDMTMPKRSGPEALAEIRQIDPHVKAIYLSGYSADSLTAADAANTSAFLNKPFKPADLARTVRTALDG